MFVPFKLGTCHECLYELWEINRAYLFVCHRYWLRGSTLLQISPWMEWRWEVVVKIHTKEPCNFEVSIESQVSFGCSKLGFLKRLLLVFCCRRHYYVFNIWISCFFALGVSQEFLHSGNMTEAGPLDQIADNDNEIDESISLPGVLKGMDSEEFLV